jgi:hypothetical protein
MTAKYTPGPWIHIPRERDGHADKIAVGHNVFINVGCPHIERPILDYPHDNEQTANANLIAAAPELLETMKNLFEQCAMIARYGGTDCNTKEADKAILAAKAAIAKAEGRT